MAPPASAAARTAAPATHGGAVRPAPARRPQQRPARPPRRVSGRAAPAPTRSGSVALPVRVLDAPFARSLRIRTSGVLDALLAGRGWIVLVGVLLVGIVFFNVDLLRMNREIALTAEKSTALKRDNARLRQEAALLGSSERIRDAAAELGLVLPGAGDVRYLKAHPAFDARNAARNIVEPTDVAVLPAETITEPPAATAPTTADPTAALPDAAATGEAAAAGTVTEGTTAIAPTATTDPAVSTTDPSG
jgi:cell division protein FtsL